ncbi:MAG TPA: hypothetical protein PKM25_10105 [Candidatus Ozemobacteraceae bacterium]|nr:hypothetical protein [Candidatus Ozemobacteraceae bacterium]
MQMPMNDEKLSNLLPRTVKIDLDTPLETAWNVLAGFSGIGCFFILQIGFLGGKHSPPDPSFLKFLPYAIGAVVVFLLLRRLTDNYYLVDRQRKAIFYHFECAVIRSVTQFMKFSDIDAVVVNGSVHHSKHSRWFEYQIQLVDRNGKTHDFSDSLKADNLGLLNSRAETISKIIECRLFPGKSEHIHTIAAAGGSQIFIFTSHSPLNAGAADISNIQISWKLAVLVLTAVLAFFGFIAWETLK